MRTPVRLRARRAAHREPERQANQGVGGREAQKGIDERHARAIGHDGEHHADVRDERSIGGRVTHAGRKPPRGATTTANRTPAAPTRPLPTRISMYMLLLCMRGSAFGRPAKPPYSRRKLSGPTPSSGCAANIRAAARHSRSRPGRSLGRGSGRLADGCTARRAGGPDHRHLRERAASRPARC